MNTINEVKLSRVWQHWEDDDRLAALISAFRGEHDLEENLRRNKALAGMLRNEGFGIVFVDGYWIENQGTDKEVKVKEDSILVTAPKHEKSAKEFARIIHKLGNKFDQEAVIVKDKSGTNLIFKDGSVEKIGHIKPGQLGDMYTKLKTNKQASTFMFESERDDLSWFQRLAGIQ